MDVKTWTTISQLLDQALDLPPAARSAWVDGLAGEYTAFRPQLRQLLDQAERMDSAAFLATLPKFDTASMRDADADDHEAPRTAVGPYRLVRLLASGGQGSVWLAERADGMLTRPVALKLPHGLAYRAGLAERMTRERDILAGLNHPHIARLYDAGVSTDGEPYLALEYVDGQAIDRYAAERGLGVAARVRLFLQVVRAVAYAHGRLVIHRDLKPANILVTADGEARLLDFGIAKLLDAQAPVDSTLTVESGRALSLPYASPEQVEQLPLGVATDVYSLGVVLFELLTGRRPYDLPRDSAAALEHAILEGGSRRASSVAATLEVRRALTGDLDTILAKALKRAPEARYASAEALADDLERWLDGRPVLAQPDSRAYRLRKFVGRHRAAVAAAAAAIVAVLAGAGVAVWQAQVARVERDTAIREQTRARASSGFLQSLLQQATPDRPLTATELLDRGTAQLDRSQDMDEAVLAFLRYEISTHYLRFNQTDRELALLVQSAEGARRAGDFDLAAAAECAAGWSLAYRDLPAAKIRVAEGERLLAGVSRPSLVAGSDCLRAQARVLEGEGRFDEAIALIESRLPGLPAPTATTWTRSSLLRTQLSDLYSRVGRMKDALRVNEESLAEIRQRGQAGTLTEFAALNNIASNLNRMGEVVDAAQRFREVLSWLDRGVFAVTPLSVRSNVGFAELQLGNAAEALRLAEAERTADLAAGNPLQAALADLLAARSLLRLGQPEASARRLDAAEGFFQSNPRNFVRMLTETALHRAELQRAAGDVVAAGGTVDALLARLDYPARTTAPGLDRVLRLSARLRLAVDDAVTALSRASDALAEASRVARDPRRSADAGDAALLRARAHLALGHDAEARQDVELAQAALETGLGPGHALTAEANALAARLSMPIAPRP